MAFHANDSTLDPPFIIIARNLEDPTKSAMVTSFSSMRFKNKFCSATASLVEDLELLNGMPIVMVYGGPYKVSLRPW